jgi:hypothetical protein
LNASQTFTAPRGAANHSEAFKGAICDRLRTGGESLGAAITHPVIVTLPADDPGTVLRALSEKLLSRFL